MTTTFHIEPQFRGGGDETLPWIEFAWHPRDRENHLPDEVSFYIEGSDIEFRGEPGVMIPFLSHLWMQMAGYITEALCTADPNIAIESRKIEYTDLESQTRDMVEDLRAKDLV